MMQPIALSSNLTVAHNNIAMGSTTTTEDDICITHFFLFLGCFSFGYCNRRRWENPFGKEFESCQMIQALPVSTMTPCSIWLSQMEFEELG
jgi:hypothetical protein